MVSRGETRDEVVDTIQAYNKLLMGKSKRQLSDEDERRLHAWDRDLLMGCGAYLLSYLGHPEGPQEEVEFIIEQVNSKVADILNEFWPEWREEWRNA